MARVEYEVIENLKLIELSRFCRVERARIVTMVEHGILSPVGTGQEDWAFDATSIRRAVQARRLELDLGLNDAGIALVLDLLEERAALLRRLSAGDDED